MRSSLGSIQKIESGYYKVTATVGIDQKTGKQKRRSKRVRGSKREAEIVLNQLIATGDVTNENITLAEMTAQYLEHQKDSIKQATYLDYQKLCVPIYDASFAKIPIKDMAKKEHAVREWLGGFSCEWTRRAEYKMLRQVLNFAKKRHMLEVSPLDFIDPPNPKRKEITTVSTKTLPLYLNAVRNTDIEAGILLMLFMGLRRSEVCARRWSDVDFDEQSLDIYSSSRMLNGGGLDIGETKTEKSKRKNYIPLPCLERLKKIKKGEWICETEGHPMRPDIFSKKWRKLIRKAGLDHVPVKNLRHSCGTMLIREMGASIADVAELLGHSTTRTTEQFYLQQSDESKKRVANLWTN